MAEKIYLCSTYYHVLIATLKTFSAKEPCAIAVTHYIPEYQALAQRINKANIYSEVHVIDANTEYQAGNKIKKLLFLHERNRKMIAQQLPFDLLQYPQIYIFHDDTWMAHYLQDCRKPYHLLEDGLDSFCYIKQSCFAYMVEEGLFKKVIKKLFHYGYQYCGKSPYTVQVEVNSMQGLQLPKETLKKVVESPRKALMERLSSEELCRLNEIFQFTILRNLEINGQENILLLTQPFYEDGVLTKKETQIALYQNIVEKYCADCQGVVYIKPHPRDNTEYAKLLWNTEVKVLDKNMPVELLKLNGLEKKFKEVISVNSTAMYALDGITEKVMLGFNYTKSVKGG